MEKTEKKLSIEQYLAGICFSSPSITWSLTDSRDYYLKDGWLGSTSEALSECYSFPNWRKKQGRGDCWRLLVPLLYAHCLCESEREYRAFALCCCRPLTMQRRMSFSSQMQSCRRKRSWTRTSTYAAKFECILIYIVVWWSVPAQTGQVCSADRRYSHFAVQNLWTRAEY